MTTSTDCVDFPALTGRQEPHAHSEFDGYDDLGEKAIRLARKVGRRSMPWQVRTLFAILRTGLDGLWTHADVVLIVPRQNGKTLIMVLRIMFGLFVLHERIVYTAQRWKTAEDAYNRLWGIIRVRPSLLKRVVRHTLSQGNGYIELTSGGKVLFCTRSADAGRGLDEVDLIIYDEAYNLTEAETSALNPTQLASRNPQTIYTSSPVNADIHPNGHVLAGLRKQGHAFAPGLLFLEWLAPADMARGLESTWQYANPSYGVIQNAAKVRKLMRTATTAAGRKSFDVEVLGRGDYPVAAEDIPALIAPAIWSAMTNRTPTLVGSIALSADMTPDRKLLAIAAAQWTAEGRIHIEIGYYGPPTPQIVGYFRTLVARYDPCCLVIDRQSPAMSFVDDLLNEGIEATTTTTAEYAAGCGGFYDDSLAEQLGHTGDPDLAEEINGATKRILPGGGWAWDRLGANPIAMVVAGTGARWGLVKFGTRTRPKQQLAVERRAVSARSETADLATASF